jgi:hypothetical protein
MASGIEHEMQQFFNGSACIRQYVTSRNLQSSRKYGEWSSRQQCGQNL